MIIFIVFGLTQIRKFHFELDDLDKGMYFVQILEEKNIISSEKLMVK
jgi:hypothetical protein